MKNILTLLLLICIFSCKDHQDEPQPVPEIQQLTNHTKNIYQVRISPDGSTIFYTIYKNQPNGDLHTEIYSIKSDGSNQKKILTYPNHLSYAPIVSANGKLLAFETMTYANSGNVSDLHLVNSDGSNLRKVISANTTFFPYSFADDDKTLVYGKNMSIGNCSCNTIWKTNLNGTQNKMISSKGVVVDVTSDKELFLVDDYVGNAYLMDAEGNNFTNLAPAIPVKISPLKTFVALRKSVTASGTTNPTLPQSWQVFGSGMSGTDFKQLTTSTAQNYPIDFFPDGSRILFTSMDYSAPDKLAELYSVTLDGSEVKRLTDNEFRETAIGFLEKKNKVLFTSSKDGKVNLYVLNLKE
ncbi:TolB family protein [Rufibacter roseus]|uniref:PD40 domain-containing protein n=1 Tax=Rufibacter roseus TaxID=1567108 RepID=A0ABW2DJ28_9BACT|nr:PD40 domain-containing protein [Rufibacter roseus]